MHLRKLKYLIVLFIFTESNSFGQTSSDSTDHAIRTATDLKSGNAQDVLTSFFQIAFKDINVGGRFQFNSSLVAFCGNADKNLLIDKEYLHKKFLRNSNFNIDVAFNDDHQYKNATLGFKYAIVNNRDTTIFYTANNYPSIIDEYEKEELKIKAKINSEYSLTHIDEADKINTFLSRSDEVGFEDLSPGFQDYLTQILDTDVVFKNVPPEKFNKFINNLYRDAINNFSKKGLLTLGAAYTIDPKANVYLEYLKGISNPLARTGLEFNGRADLNVYDTLISGSQKGRSDLNANAGLNFVVKNSENQPVIEFKASATYLHVFSGLDDKENNDLFTANGTLRFRINRGLWFPIDIKYDPKTGNVFGFLNITTNFDAIRSFL